MNTPTMNPDNRKPQGQKPVPPPAQSKTEATSQQLAMCYVGLQTLMPYVVPPVPPESVPGRPDLDGGAAAATTSAVVTLCNRIESIVNDESRWGVAGYNEHLQRVQTLTDLSVENAQAYKETLRRAALPSSVLSIRTFLDPETRQWVAVLPGVDGTRPVMGVGRTPELAHADFNRVYFEGISAQQAEQDALDETPKPQPPKRKRTK